MTPSEHISKVQSILTTTTNFCIALVLLFHKVLDVPTHYRGILSARSANVFEASKKDKLTPKWLSERKVTA